MNFVCKLLRWNDKPAEDLRMQMRESTAFLSAHAEDLTRTMVLKVDDIKKSMDGIK